MDLNLAQTRPRQARPDSVSSSAWRVAWDVLRRQGPQGLYRGGLPVVLGGTMFRSAQFGFYEAALGRLRRTTPSYKFLGFLDWQVAVAGCVGGIARGVIEAPFDQVKVCRQVEHSWSVRTLFQGSGVTILRNTALFCSFSIYRASEHAAGPCRAVRSSISLLREAAQTHHLYRGLLPGLGRSTVPCLLGCFASGMWVDIESEHVITLQNETCFGRNSTRAAKLYNLYIYTYIYMCVCDIYIYTRNIIYLYIYIYT
ncbi:unnamed protein product [Cladocopium goreaui]|uniref:Calpain catalytic domain-containing protein n=1 Tax=Cladocopium goreaui TaxID=2562237 RepID=A0A9P1FJL8_9DINO|nr:unnamed protein product [Cladocopium goreaui]